MKAETLADLLEQLGGVSPRRVCIRPAPGEVAEQELLRFNEETDRTFELVDGTLVEKPVGYPESFLAADLVRLFGRALDQHDQGEVAAGVPLRLAPGVVRLIDVLYVRWGQYAHRQRPSEPITSVYPDLAIDILRPTNTPGEMARKREEYFDAGARLVWQVDSVKRTIDIYTGPDQVTTLREGDTLDGGVVLSLSLPVADVFARVPRPAKTPPRRKKKT